MAQFYLFERMSKTTVDKSNHIDIESFDHFGDGGGDTASMDQGPFSNRLDMLSSSEERLGRRCSTALVRWFIIISADSGEQLRTRFI